MTLRDCITTAWLGFGASVLLITWQLAAYLTDSIPNHILPIVRVISGTHEALPIAYSWTLRIGLISVLMFLGSLVALLGGYFLRQHQRNDNTRNA